jgi:hypothetical protein
MIRAIFCRRCGDDFLTSLIYGVQHFVYSSIGFKGCTAHRFVYMCLIKIKSLVCVERGLPSANFVKDSLFLRLTGRTLVLS